MAERCVGGSCAGSAAPQDKTDGVGVTLQSLCGVCLVLAGLLREKGTCNYFGFVTPVEVWLALGVVTAVPAAAGTIVVN